MVLIDGYYMPPTLLLCLIISSLQVLILEGMSEDVLKTCLEDVLKTCLEGAFKRSWRQTKCLLEISVSNKSKCVSNKFMFHKSISDESKENPKCINWSPIISVFVLF